MTLQELVNDAQKLINKNPKFANMIVAAEVNDHLCREVIAIADRPAGYDTVIRETSLEEQRPTYILLAIAGID